MGRIVALLALLVGFGHPTGGPPRSQPIDAVREIRERLLEADARSLPPSGPTEPRLVQWPNWRNYWQNWPNWPNWGNWPNWPNWRNW